MLSPLLFNIYKQRTISKLYEEVQAEIEIHGDKIIILRYAEDLALLEENEEAPVLEKALTDMSRTIQNYNIKINTSKTEIQEENILHLAVAPYYII